MTWFDAVPSFLAALTLVFLPGLVLARTLGARGITWLAVAAPLSATLIGVGAIIAQVAHVRWTPLALVLMTLTVSAVTWIIRYFVELRWSKETSPLWVRSPRQPLLVCSVAWVLVQLF
ncbi:hypothetical protein NHF46_15760 [Arthrobacter alpinus]|nr:hypothetical protein [Arthrobacter alpinus]